MSKRKTTKKAVSSLIVPKKKPTASTIKKYAGLNGKAAAIKKFGKDAVQKAQFKVDQKAFNVRKNRPKNKNKPTEPLTGYKSFTPKQKRQMDDDFETRDGSLLIEEPTQKQYDYFDNLSSRIKSAERAARKTGGKVVKAKKGGGLFGKLASMAKPVKKKTKAFINRQKMDILPSKTPKDRSNIKSGVAVKRTSVQEPKGKIKTESPSEKNKTVSKVQKVYKKGGFKTSRVNPKTKKPKVMGPGGRASQAPKQAKAIKKNVVKRDIRRNLKRGALGAGVVTGLYQLGKAASKKPPMAATDSSSSGGSYKIKSGDTLSQIAKRRGTTLKALLAANPSIKNANKIRVGQTIKMSKPVKKRKSVYQGLSKSRMSKMAMPKKKKMAGGKVVKRDMGGSIGPMNNSKQDMRKERKRKMTAAAKSKYGSSYKGKVKKDIDKVINKKSARTRNETINKAEKMIKNNPKMFSGRPSSILTKEGFEKVNRKRMAGGKVVKRGKGGSVGSNLVAGCYDT